MNIINAIKTGKAIRRKDNPRHAGSNGNGWLSSEYVLTLMTPGHTVASFFEWNTISRIVTRTDILATDWEVKRSKK